MGIKAKANKDVIKVTIDQYDLKKAFSDMREYDYFLTELLINIKEAERRYQLEGDTSFQNFMYEQHLKRLKEDERG